jgi:DNA-binding response OmpR family regulator
MPRILVVEDDADLQFLYHTMLSRRGYEVVTTETATDAIAALADGSFDLLILDINLPDYPGTHVIEYMHTNGARAHNTPILVISAHDGSRSAVYAMGVRNFLIKPVHMQDLLATVDEMLPD